MSEDELAHGHVTGAGERPKEHLRVCAGPASHLQGCTGKGHLKWSLKEQALQEEGGESGSPSPHPQGAWQTFIPIVWESFLFPYSLCTLRESGGLLWWGWGECQSPLSLTPLLVIGL